ncbi:MAG: hypothetical protein FJX95_05270 [Bacteroidetes bacterium]|nr:hypothetical protein [Bacteroidota bacterium]
MKSYKSFIYSLVLILVIVATNSCTRARYTGFGINEIKIESGLEGITTPNNYFFKIEGKEINDETQRVTIYPGFSSASFFTNFSANKEQKKYKVTLMREETSGEYEVYSFDIKFIDHAGQESFTISPGEGYKFQFKMDWPAYW